MPVFRKRSTPGLRARKRIHTPSEALPYEVLGADLVVTTDKPATIRDLLRKGWREVEPRPEEVAPPPIATPKPSAPEVVEPLPEPTSLKALRELAKAKGIKGRSKMTRDELIAALDEAP